MIVVALAALIGLPVVAALAIFGLKLRQAAGLVTVAVALVMLTAAVSISWRVVLHGPQLAVEDTFFIDQLGVVVLVLIAIVGVCAALNSLGYISHEVEQGDIRSSDVSRYYALFLMFMATMVTVPVVNNLGIMWVAIEATTVVSVLLVSIYRTGRSLEAAWKYLLIASVGIAIALFGTMMTYYAAASSLGESTSALNWTVLSAADVHLDPQVMRLAFVFIIVGFGTKVGLAPMHTWLPDAHSQAPSPISGLLSGVLLNCALYAVLRFKVLTADATGPSYPNDILIAFGLFSMALAVPFLAVQNDLKRMLGYSSVEHMGIIVLAVGIGGTTALYAALLHMVAHSLTKSSLFFASGAVVQAFGSRSMHRMRGFLKIAPIPGAVVLIGVAALVAMPPFAMFTSEYGLVAGAFSVHRGLAGSAGILLIALATASLLFHVVGTAYGVPRPSVSVQKGSSTFALSVAVPLLLLVWVSIAPPARFEQTLNQAVAIVDGH